MAIRFLTDSTAEILPKEAAERGITVVPLKSIFGETTYRDGMDMTHEEFYKLLGESKQLPTTSQPTPDEFLTHFEAAKEAGDELICLTLSSGISGTYQSACIAKDLCDYDKIYVVDSIMAVMGMRMMLDLGEKMRADGSSAAEIAAEMERIKGKIRLYLIVDTLEYLHKGGRVSTAVTIVGGMLKMKPVLTLADGVLSVKGKGVGVKGSLNVIEELVGQPVLDERVGVYYGYTANDTLCKKLVERLEGKFSVPSAGSFSIGNVIGTHTGPGIAAVVYLEK